MNPKHLTDLETMWRRLAETLAKDATLVTALEEAAEVPGLEDLAGDIAAIREAIGNGARLSEAVNARPAVSSECVVAVLEAHEAGGGLAEAARVLADALRADSLPVKPRDHTAAPERAQIIFWRAMAVMLGTGVPVARTLRSICKDLGDNALALVVRRIADMVGAGSMPSDAMDEFPRVFSSGVRSLMRAGERGGVMEQAAEAIAADLEEGLLLHGSADPAKALVIEEPAQRGRTHRMFWRQVGRMMGSCGAPAIEALLTAGWDSKNKALFEGASRIAEDLRGGSTLAVAIRRRRDVFSEAACKAMAAAEFRGDIDRAAMELSERKGEGELVADLASDAAESPEWPDEAPEGQFADLDKSKIKWREKKAGDLSAPPPVARPDGEVRIESLDEMSTLPPARKLLNLVLLQAIHDRASDIHFEGFADKFTIRYRIDGVLYEMVPQPVHLSRAVISRIKVMANMDIAESRRPQFGRIELNVNGHRVDAVVHVMPCIDGQRCTLSLVDEDATKILLRNIGLTKPDRGMMKGWVQRPHGIVLVTGPPRSGKTTTLHALVNELKRPDKAIVSIEQPVHGRMEGVAQVKLNPSIGFDWLSGIRSALAQGSDVLVLGDLPDVETVDAACQAALTGRLVLSTLPVTDAAGAITWLLDMGCRPHLVSATLVGISCQRLVRKLCDCKFEVAPDALSAAEQAFLADAKLDRVHVPKGCDACYRSGYKGRVGIYELLAVGEPIRRAIVQTADTDAIRKLARDAGMDTLRDAGLEKIREGVTSVAEVMQTLAF